MKTDEQIAHLEHLLRVEFWRNHGCDPNSRYGDDGEMQCNCGVDFRRMPMSELETYVFMKRMFPESATKIQAEKSFERFIGNMKKKAPLPHTGDDKKIRTCNRHVNCDKADADAKQAGRSADHCRDDCCEDCFGS